MQKGNLIDFAGRRVLIVEDELLTAMVLEDLLVEHGCRVMSPVATMVDSINSIAAERPEVVTLDLNLAGRTTVPLAKVLTDSGIPFVVVTGFEDEAIVEPVLRAAPIVHKPWNESELLDGVARALGIDRAPRVQA
jgi:AmiR/NasT family two-component response regulator